MRRQFILWRLAWQLIWLRVRGPRYTYESRRILFDCFAELGGVYVKFLQQLALSVDFMRGWSQPHDFDVFETGSLEAIDVQRLVATVPDIARMFDRIDPSPIAAGSFAQVYRAWLQDGTAVVVKVLRPSLTQNLTRDLRTLHFVSKLASWLYPQTMIDVSQLYRDFASTVRAETNYVRETDNALWFYGYFSQHPHIVIPFTFRNLSTKDWLTQEYIGGISLAQVLQQENRPAYVQQTTGSDMWWQLQTLGTELLTACLQADFIFGDPHPGNIKLLSGNRIGLIDFGIAAHPPAQRNNFRALMETYYKTYVGEFDAAEFTQAALRFFDPRLADALETASEAFDLPSKTIMATVGQSAGLAARQERAGQLLAERRLLELFGANINRNNRLGLHFDTSTAGMLKSALTFLSLCRSLAEHGENIPMVREALYAALTQTQGHIAQERAPLPPDFATSFERISDWLSSVADRDPFLYPSHCC